VGELLCGGVGGWNKGDFVLLLEEAYKVEDLLEEGGRGVAEFLKELILKGGHRCSCCGDRGLDKPQWNDLGCWGDTIARC